MSNAAAVTCAVSSGATAPVILVVGPTASGKTDFAHRLCTQFGTENCGIVNLDILQVYTSLDIGTAKPNLEEQKLYHYSNIDTHDPLARLDAQSFAAAAWKCVHRLRAAGKLAVVVGGSGLPARAFLTGLSELPQADDSLRLRLRAAAERFGWPYLHEQLACVDSARAKQLHPNDRTRIERALELFILTGKTPTELYLTSNLQTGTGILDEKALRPLVKVVRFQPAPEWLKPRIEERVYKMMEAGWVAEVASLVQQYGKADLCEAQSMRAIGYREILADSGKSDSLSALIVTRTWQYARRQLTWNAGERADLLIHSHSVAQLLQQELNLALNTVLKWAQGKNEEG